ncbi:hypothetical protein QBC36DRAFT_307537 [Triangularia setosa]|uniref:Uncharacterized protein n=1 Tax=Triangularia setosa TaxID=2587417 RepID=A0AAN7A9G1_9PEZI|nr:hypothetical protein QBC36DRAFT_307537 [Podospora setosa]
MWSDYKQEPTADGRPLDDNEQKAPSIWDGAGEFSCTSSKAELLPQDAITQHGIVGWHIRMIMNRQARYQKRCLENLIKQNQLTYGFPRFQDWLRDPSLTYEQN